MRWYKTVGVTSLLWWLTYATACYAWPPGINNFRQRAVLPSLIEVSWQEVPGVSDYQLERQEAKGPWIRIVALPAGKAFFQSVGMKGGPDLIYRHRIRVVKGSKAGPWTVSDPVSTPARSDKPQSGQVITASDSNQGASWKRHGENCIWVNNQGHLIVLDSVHDGFWDHLASHLARYRSQDNGQTWEYVRVEVPGIGQGIHQQHWKPSVARVDEKRLVLTYTHNRLPQGRFKGWQGRRVARYSDDDGQTWSKEVYLTSGGNNHETGYGGHSVITLSSGRVIHAFTVKATPKSPPSMMISFSDDQGQTWQQAYKTPKEIPGGFNCDEPSLVEYQPGKLTVFIRAKKTGYLYYMQSNDHGISWTEPTQNILRHGNNPAEALMIPGTNTIVLITNFEMPPEDPAGAARHIMACCLSDDGGLSWYNYKEIENLKDWSLLVDYPAAVFNGNDLHVVFRMIEGRLHSTYEHVWYRKLNKAWLFEKP